MTVQTVGDWGFGSAVGLLALAAAALTCVLAPVAFRPSRDRLATAITMIVRRVRSRRTAARHPGRHQAGTVATPVAVPVIPGYDAAQTAMLTARAVTLLEDTRADIPVIAADITRNDLPVITTPSGHYPPADEAVKRAIQEALAEGWSEEIRVQRRDGTGPHAYRLPRSYLPASTLPAPRHAAVQPRAMADDGRD